jgi:pantoate--beta-alanine ligase
MIPDEEKAKRQAALRRDVAEMYPAGFATNVSVSGVSGPMDGEVRPIHFAGVATIVAKLLTQSVPDVAIFGEKDYQQLLVIKRVARDLDLPVEVIGGPTVRERDGLALSSRNVYLTAGERAVAPRLHAALRTASAALRDSMPVSAVEARGYAALVEAGFGPVDYFDVRDAEEDLTLQVRVVHDVVVHEADRPDARRGEVEGER